MLSNGTNKILIGTLLKSERDNLTSLLEVFDTNGWPDAEIIKIGVNHAIRDLTTYFTSNRSHKVHQSTQEVDKLWERFLSKSNFVVHECPPMLLNHLLFKGYSLSVQQMLKNTPSSSLKTWLSEKDMYSTFYDTGRDKCSNLGLLVQNGCPNMIQTLVNLDPTYIHMLDHKKRTALFYARNIDMVAYLSSQKVDASLKDKDGFDAVQTWTEILKHPEASKWMEALAQVDAPSRVVQKMFSMQLNTLNEEEKISFENSAQNNSIWQGNVFGCEKAWSLSEIWNFTMVLHAVNLMKSPTLKTYYYYGDNLIRKDPKGFKDILAQQQQHMPLALQNQIEQKTNQSLALQWLISLCKQWDGTPNRLIEVDEVYIKDQTNYSSSKSSVGAYLTPLDKILEHSTDNDRREFALALSSYTALTDLWSTPTVMQRFSQANKMFVLPIEKGGVLSAELASSIAFLRLNEGLRSKDALFPWVENFKKYGVPAWNEDVKNQEDLQKWAPVLQLGLSYSPLAANVESPAVHTFNATLQDMLMHNVEIEKIPARFAKHMPDSLRSAASRWVINKTLTKVKPKEETPAPRRRM